jgi:aminoglycoside 6'-N-acetyltransferase
MSQKNRSHLLRYEADNVVTSIQSEGEAEILVRELAVEWVARNCFFLGAFEKASGEFVAQIYVGPVSWDLPEFEIGYFADVDHEGRGFVTEAVQGALHFIFEHLQAHRVRLRCDDTNVRSGSVAERCGFVREGHLRENKKNPDGTFSGTLCYGLLKSEFECEKR